MYPDWSLTLLVVTCTVGLLCFLMIIVKEVFWFLVKRAELDEKREKERKRKHRKKV